ncbi:MAG: ArsR/SmtB family transcription factor [Alkalilacustris sp.]
MPADDETVARLAKALAHPARVRIVRFLLSRPGCIGGDIVEDVGLAQSTVSEHLRILKASGLVVGRIDYPRICYALEPTALAPLRGLVAVIEARTETGTADMCHTSEGCIPRADVAAKT